jgi:hypothetical protein
MRLAASTRIIGAPAPVCMQVRKIQLSREGALPSGGARMSSIPNSSLSLRRILETGWTL